MREVKKYAFEDIATIITGNTPSTKKEEYYGGNFPFVSPADLGKDKVITKAKNYLSEEGKKVARVLPKNTVLLCCIGATIGKVGIAGRELTTNQQINSLVFDENKVFPMFGYYYCSTLTPLLKGKSHSTTLPIISKGKLSKFKIPLPPLAEQKKIAAILDEADKVRQLNRSLLAEYDALSQSLFLDMFGNILVNDKKWSKERVGEISSSRLGKMLDKKKQTGKFLKPYIKNTNVKWFVFDLNDLPEMDFDSKDRVEFRLKYGDVLVCEGGEVGRAAIWKNDIEECYFQKALHRVKLNKKKINGEYFVYWLKEMARLNGFKNYVSSVTIAHLTGVKFKSMNIPLPPIALQTEFARRIEEIEGQKAQAAAALSESEDLFAALLQNLFRP